LRPTRRRRTNRGVDAPPQIYDIRLDACGLILGLALIANNNPKLEMACRIFCSISGYARLSQTAGDAAARRAPETLVTPAWKNYF
jgi:hypothetical protein